MGYTLIAGGVTGALAAGAVTPCDVVKTTIQRQGGPSSIRVAVAQVFGTGGIEGYMRFWRGVGPRCFVQGALFAFALLFYETQKKIVANMQKH